MRPNPLLNRTSGHRIGVPADHSQTSPGSGRPRRLKARQRQRTGVLPTLKCAEALTGTVAKTIEIKSQGLPIAASQPSQAFPQQHRGAALIPPLQVEMGDGNLKDALQGPPARSAGLMPELFKTIVAGVPLAGVELGHRCPEAIICLDGGLLRIDGRCCSQQRLEGSRPAAGIHCGQRGVAGGRLGHPRGGRQGGRRCTGIGRGWRGPDQQPQTGPGGSGCGGGSGPVISAWPSS